MTKKEFDTLKIGDKIQDTIGNHNIYKIQHKYNKDSWNYGHGNCMYGRINKDNYNQYKLIK